MRSVPEDGWQVEGGTVTPRELLLKSKTGAMLLTCSCPTAIDHLNRGEWREATIAQARSAATFTGRRRWNGHRELRRGAASFRSYSARTFYYLIRRALREASKQT